MKKLFCFLFLICMLHICTLLAACGKTEDFSSTIIAAPKDIEVPFRLAETECERMFAHLPGFDITGANVGGRSDDAAALVIEFTYTHENGEGQYGFLCDTDNNGDYYIVSHGETVTIEKLVN